MGVVADKLVDGSAYKTSKWKFSSLHFLMFLTLLAVFAFAFILAFEFSYDKIINSRFFTLNEIAVYGNKHVSTSIILDATELRTIMSINSVYSIMPHIIEKRIKSQFSYLENVKVKRIVDRDKIRGIYGLLVITVKEREPVALIPCREDSGSFMVVDNNGILLEELKGDVRFTGPYLNMPVIIGVDEVVLKNRKDEIPEVDTALEVISRARVSIPELFNQISYIDSREPEDIKLYLQNPGLSSRTELKIRLAKDRIKEGLEDVLPVVKKIRLDRKEVEYIDLRFPGAVYCMDVEKPDNAVINQMTGKSGTESHIR